MTQDTNGLPELCYATHPSTGELVILKRGEIGYFPTEGYRSSEAMPFTALADHLNTRMGVTKGQRAAMEAGSIFGWDLPIARASLYTDDGRLAR